MGVDKPPPDGVIVILPFIATSGVTVKLVDAEPAFPDAGPDRVNDKYGLREYITDPCLPLLDDHVDVME